MSAATSPARDVPIPADVLAEIDLALSALCRRIARELCDAEDAAGQTTDAPMQRSLRRRLSVGQAVARLAQARQQALREDVLKLGLTKQEVAEACGVRRQAIGKSVAAKRNHG